MYCELAKKEIEFFDKPVILGGKNTTVKECSEFKDKIINGGFIKNGCKFRSSAQCLKKRYQQEHK
ncbi:hypothetical protein Clopa_1884 [Clostridium pasteurianum BC1]|uniref:Uncharacterized protein n=2 Tax=Clostridium pasteurianum TaxID=1501 RepID=R4K8D0_CLOPA|nr:hypothetical protein Clopa_1884 [Clostridium pasteurianum BC1]